MVVVTRQSDYQIDVGGVEIAHSLEESVRRAQLAGEVEAFIIGGAELYREALPRANKLYVTRVCADVAGDTLLPKIDWSAWRLMESEQHAADDRNDHPLVFEVYERQRMDNHAGNTES
jgi:dihydrofolate reductase